MDAHKTEAFEKTVHDRLYKEPLYLLDLGRLLPWEIELLKEQVDKHAIEAFDNLSGQIVVSHSKFSQIIKTVCVFGNPSVALLDSENCPLVSNNPLLNSEVGFGATEEGLKRVDLV